MAEALRELPTVAEVAAYLGEAGDATVETLAATHLTHVVALARSRTRGRGFDGNGRCADDLAAVIVAATARQLGNPEQDRRMQFGDFSVLPTTGWSLVEQAVLNRWRKTAL